MFFDFVSVRKHSHVPLNIVSGLGIFGFLSELEFQPGEFLLDFRSIHLSPPPSQMIQMHVVEDIQDRLESAQSREVDHFFEQYLKGLQVELCNGVPAGWYGVSPHVMVLYQEMNS